MIKKLEMDMTTGPLLRKLIRYAIPLIFTNILQNLFHSADVLMLGIFISDSSVSDIAVGAVSANTSLITLITSLFIGISVGTNVLVGRHLGEGDSENTKNVIAMSIILSIVCSFVMMAIALIGSHTFLVWMNCPEDIIGMAEVYLRVYFMGIPFVMLYNVCSAIFRAAGDTKRPFIFLVMGGIINIIGNYFFIKMGMPIEGVAISTIVSQGVSAIICLIILFKNNGICKLEIKRCKIFKGELKELLYIGIPSGLNSIIFSITNVIIASVVNSFGSATVTANGVASQFDSIVYTLGNSNALACMAFINQNYGKKNFKRIKLVIVESILMGIIIQLSVGILTVSFGRTLCGIATDSEEIIDIAMIRLKITCLSYFLCGFMDLFSYGMRSMGRSITATIITLFCAGFLRILWIYVLMNYWNTFAMVIYGWPVSWILADIVYIISYVILLRKEERKYQNSCNTI